MTYLSEMAYQFSLPSETCHDLEHSYNAPQISITIAAQFLFIILWKGGVAIVAELLENCEIVIPPGCQSALSGFG